MFLVSWYTALSRGHTELVDRLRRWPNTRPTLSRYLVFAGVGVSDNPHIISSPLAQALTQVAMGLIPQLCRQTVKWRYTLFCWPSGCGAGVGGSRKVENNNCNCVSREYIGKMRSVTAVNIQ